MTIAELRAGRDDWWDTSFTRALVDPLSGAGPNLAEVGCGLGRVAQETLPHLHHHTYLGIDLDAGRIAEAHKHFVGQPLGRRVRFTVGRAEALPLAARSLDVVLFCMTLQHVIFPEVALGEARRVLRAGGLLLAAEPDNLGQRWFFDGTMEPLILAFASLVDRCRQARWPADLAIGPRVPALARAAGLADVDLRVHAVFAARQGPAHAFAAHFNRISSLFAVASGLSEDHPGLVACRDAAAAWLSEGDSERIGRWGSTVPIYLTTARQSIDRAANPPTVHGTSTGGGGCTR